MYPPAQPVKKSSRILGKIARVIKWFFIIIGVLFTIFVLIGIFVFEPERRAEEAAAARIILVPTYTPTPGEPTPTAVPPTAIPAPPTATRRPAPTPRPSPTETTDYPTSLMVAISDLSPTMIAVTNMLDHPQYGDEQWMASIRQELDLIDK